MQLDKKEVVDRRRQQLKINKNTIILKNTMNNIFKDIKKTYKYVYAIINSDIKGKKFLKNIDNKINKR